jgi:hypothetical protein
VVFGYLIGVSGCWFGMNAGGGTEGVGQAATRVVVSIFLVLVSDVVLVKFIQVLHGEWEKLTSMFFHNRKWDAPQESTSLN